jgi:hypothetical protein
MAIGASLVSLTGCPKENIAQPYGAPPDRDQHVQETSDAGSATAPAIDAATLNENIAKPYGAPPVHGRIT